MSTVPLYTDTAHAHGQPRGVAIPVGMFVQRLYKYEVKAA